MISTTPPTDKVARARRIRTWRSRGKYAIQGNYNGFEIYDISNPGEAGARAAVPLPGVAERRVGLQEPAVHVVRVDQQPHRLRLRRRARSGQQGSRARHPHLRHQRHQEPEARDERADVPRLAHAHRRRRSRATTTTSTSTSRARRGVRPAEELPGCAGRRHRRSEHRAVPARSDQGAARGAGEGGDRQLAAHLPGPAGARRAIPSATRGGRVRGARPAAALRRARRCAGGGAAVRQRAPAVRAGARRRGCGRARRARGGRRTRRRRRPPTGPNQCHDITVYPDIGLAGGACGGLGLLLDIRDATQPDPHRLRRPTRTCRSGTRRRSATTARRCSSPTSGAAASRRAAATPTSRSGAPTRSSRSRTTRWCSRATTRCRRRRPHSGELRRAQRLAHSDPGPRGHGAGVVPGRHLGLRLDRRRRSRRRSRSSIAARSTPTACASAGSWSAYWYNGVDRQLRDRARPRHLRAAAERPHHAERDRRGEDRAGSTT